MVIRVDIFWDFRDFYEKNKTNCYLKKEKLMYFELKIDRNLGQY